MGMSGAAARTGDLRQKEDYEECKDEVQQLQLKEPQTISRRETKKLYMMEVVIGVVGK